MVTEQLTPASTARELLSAFRSHGADVCVGGGWGVDALLEDFGLAHVAQLYASELSYGQRKLVEFAAVLMSEPAMVLLDEPTAGVNPALMATMERHIRERHEKGVTFLVVEHDMEFVMRVCDPVIVLDHGRPIFSGTPAEVQTNPLVLDAYLGA